jgi:hypothetical protein
MYALCRDNAIVFSETLSQIHPTLHSPINSIIFLFFIQSSLLLIPLFNATGGTAALNNILSLSIVGFQISYLIPIFWKAFLFLSPEHSKKIYDLLENSSMSLGKYSAMLGQIACLWLTLTLLVLFLPFTYPVTSTSMNYTCVMLVGVLLFGTFNWEFYSKNNFRGPRRYDDQVGEGSSLINPLISRSS